ncbi:MAG: chitobiase/beta-hexosaminidase C-terminal domain-containing protein [Candidatus Korobacteraceae bacterium]
MKALLCALLLLTSLGCGGYGSGMGMTPAPMPTLSPAAGIHPTPQTITISDSLQSATIYYTIDGSTPTLSSPIYRGPFMITQTTRVEAIAAAGGYTTSAVAIADYTLQ